MKDERIIRLFYIANLIMPTFEEINRSILSFRKGIYLGIRPIYKNIDEEIYGQIIGELPENKVLEKITYAQEKINRMKLNNEFCSFESEDIENKKYGGGIRTRNFFIGPSGLPPHLDQEFAIIVALFAKELPIENLNEIRKRSFEKVSISCIANGEKPLID